MIHRRPADDACQDDDDDFVTRLERFEPADPRQRQPLNILIAREAAEKAMGSAIEPRSTFHRSPIGGHYHDRREDDRRDWERLAAEARREAWADRHATMIMNMRILS